MGRISIDVTDQEHRQLKALAALRGQSVKDFVLAQTLGNEALMEASREAMQTDSSRYACGGEVNEEFKRIADEHFEAHKDVHEGLSR